MTSGWPFSARLIQAVIAPFLCSDRGPYTLANRNATVSRPYEPRNAWQYPSPLSLLAPYGLIGRGTLRSSTGGGASPISAPPVDAKTNRPTPAPTEPHS